jgi:acyl-coenzyme A thioesterase PaaI-like protein
VVGSPDAASQVEASRAVVASVTPFLGGPRARGDGWSFDFGEHLESNWGAVYGGALAAGMLAVARCVAPEQSPRSLHLQMVRSVPRGIASATAEMRHGGRTVGTIEVDLYDGRGKLAAVALLTMVTPGGVAANYHDTRATPFDVRTTPFEEDQLVFAPIQGSLHMLREQNGVYHRGYDEHVRSNVDGTKSPIGKITVPWRDLDLTGAEVACLAADAIVGAPVITSFVGRDAAGPNPDISLRFTTAPATRIVQTSGTMLSVQHGTATVAIEVQAGDQHLAHGLSTSLLLPK